MKLLILPLLFLLISCKQENVKKENHPIPYKPLMEEKFKRVQVQLSKVDSINTNAEVLKYLTKIDSGFTYLTIEKTPYSDALKNPDIDSITKERIKSSDVKKSFYKSDFDNNGYNDLLVLGGWGVTSTAYEGERLEYKSYVVMNFGDKPAKIYDMQSFIVPKIRYEAEEAYLIKHPLNNGEKDVKEIKLTGKFGVFTEYNEKPVDNRIEKIEYEAGPCLGKCPYFKLTINKDKSALLNATAFNTNDLPDNYIKMEGNYKGRIKDEEYNQIISLLNYIDFKSLEDSYSVGHTDAPTGTLKITYDDGKTKRINDYGMRGTYGLRAAYEIFRELRFNQEWVKVK